MRKRILVVDDEIDYLHMIKLVLEQTGKYQVRTVNLASQAVFVAEDFKPDLILLDCMMPAFDGGEVASAMQAKPELKKTPMMFLTCTVSDVEHTPSRCYEGVQTYVPKTLDLDKLMELMDQKLGGPKPQPAPATTV